MTDRSSRPLEAASSGTDESFIDFLLKNDENRISDASAFPPGGGN